MQYIIDFLSSPYIIALNTILTIVLAFLTFRKNFLTFPNFRTDNLKFFFFSEGILIVSFELINTSEVPFSFKEISLIIDNTAYYPKKLNTVDFFYGLGITANAVSRLKNKEISKLISKEASTETINYGEYQEYAFLFTDLDKNLLSKKPIILLKSTLKQKKIKVLCHEVTSL